MLSDFEHQLNLTSPPTGLMQAPAFVQIALTGRCNLHCRYCYYADEMASLKDLPTEKWLSFFDEMGRLAVRRVALTGGEVFTRPDLMDLIDGIIANRMRYSILTNGTLINEKTIEELSRGKRLLRMNYIQISMDGSSADIQDQSRPASFERAKRGLLLLKKAGFPVTVRVTINPYNLYDLDNIAHFLLEEIDLPDFTSNEAFGLGTGKCERSSILLNPEQRRFAVEKMMEISQRYPGRVKAMAGPLFMGQNLVKIDELMARGETGLSGRGKLAACGEVFEHLAIRHDGVIVPCHMLPNMEMGMIGKDDFQQIWLHHPHMNRLRYRSEISLRSLPTCHDCRYAEFCTGGCPGSVWLAEGTLYARDPISCYRLFREETGHD